MKKTILLLGAVGVLMMTGCADEGITTDYGEWVATSEYSMDGTTENYRTIEVDATAEKTEAASEKEMEGSSDHMNTQKKDSTTDSGEKDQKTDQKKDNTTEKSGQKITGISSSYKKAYNSSFTLKPKAKGKITYKSSNTKVATVNSKGKVKIKGTGKVTISITAKETSAYKKQTKKVTIYAVPGKRDIKKLSSGKKKLTVQWKKDNRSDGYQVQYSTDKKFKKNVKNVVIGKKQTTKQTIKKLKTGKKYYVRILSLIHI